MKKKFKRKNEIIEAIEFDGNNVKEIEEFTNQKLDRLEIFESDSPLYMLVIKCKDGYATLTNGNWIIKTEDGVFYPFLGEHFYNVFEELNEEEENERL